MGETSADEQSIQVEDIISRSDYNENTIENDIAILKLSQDVTFSDYVVPACLPSSSSNSYTGQSATVSGWGTTSEGGDTSAFLKETSVNVVSATDSTCSGYGNDDTCRCVLMLLELTAAKETVEDLLYLMMARILLLV